MSKTYDVIIIGSGPSGIFAAMELIKRPGLKVLIIEKGKDIDKRSCPMERASIPCIRCDICNILCGWGGAGAYSDGKLTLSPNVGGFLKEYLPDGDFSSLIDYVDSIYRYFGAGEEIHGNDAKTVSELKEKAAQYGLELVPARIRHIGTELCRALLKKIREELNGKVDLLFNTQVRSISTTNGASSGITTLAGETYEAPYIIAAGGREGSTWLSAEAKRLGLSVRKNPVDIGVRVELPAVVMKGITDATYEAKLIYYSKGFHDRVRTFCMNPYGEVINEFSDGIFTVNGHGYKDKKTDNTNFAVLVSTDFTEPFDDPISYGKHIASLANLLGKGVIIQRLGDLKMGRRSTPQRIAEGHVRPTLSDATPGDLSFVLPYRHLSNILEMLEALDKLAPGVNFKDTLLYGIEVKFYSIRLKLTTAFETEIRNLFAVGDGAGITRGLIQASISGVVAAREISKRIRKL